MSEASQFIIGEKARLESEIRWAIQGFEQRTGFHPAAVDVRIYENRVANGSVEYILGKIEIEIKI